MEKADKYIYPVFNKILKRSDKETLLRQRGKVIWLTGLSGSGKTTIAKGIEEVLHREGFVCQVLDGDNIRSGINSNLGFSPEDRLENIRRIAEVSKLFINCGIITINSFISPTEKIRQMAKDIIGEDDLITVYINAPVSICEQRDVKGLYKKAREGKIHDFTGVDTPYDPPEKADVEVQTDSMSPGESVERILEYVMPLISMDE
ncbi:MAG: adenylyl-sulfate kinase [Bacteroidales bacterium]|jgi:adenylylsulfate kinase|nr:adenylyl-sulfate kinase [Bacteroidales bacterium]